LKLLSPDVNETFPEGLDAYLDLGAKDIAQLVLCLLVEESLQRRLARFRKSEHPDDHALGNSLSSPLFEVAMRF